MTTSSTSMEEEVLKKKKTPDRCVLWLLRKKANSIRDLSRHSREGVTRLPSSIIVGWDWRATLGASDEPPHFTDEQTEAHCWKSPSLVPGIVLGRWSDVPNAGQSQI